MASHQLKVHHAHSTSDFIEFTASMRLPLAPVWSAKPSLPGGTSHASSSSSTGVTEALTEVLDGWTMRYLPPLNAVLLSFDASHFRVLHPRIAFDPKHDPLSQSPYPAWDEDDEQDDEDDGAKDMVIGRSLPMVDGSGFMLVNVAWRGVAWRPLIGQQLNGVMTLSTPSHVSLIVHNLFNASVPSTHLPPDYEFDPDFPVPESVRERRSLMPARTATQVVQDKQEDEAAHQQDDEPAEGDKPTQADEEEDKEKEEDDEDEDEDEIEELEKLEQQEREEEELYAERGWWVHKETRQPLGGTHARISFTIIGLTVASSMISCTGSMLDDPFSKPSNESAIAKVTKKKASAKADGKRPETLDEDGHGDLARARNESDSEDSDRLGSDVGQGDDLSDRDDAPPPVKVASKSSRKGASEKKSSSSLSKKRVKEVDADAQPKKRKKKSAS